MILFCVDGTFKDYEWSQDSQGYASAFQNSFVTKVFEAAKAAKTVSVNYHRGPSVLGLDTVWYFGKTIGAKFIRGAKKNNPNEGITLLGYSRGGTAVLATAASLEGEYAIDYMVLLDSVSMLIGSDMEPAIPENVKQVLHLRRDPTVGSRRFWGNSGTTYTWKATNYTEYFFQTTHAGMGFDIPKPKENADDLVTEPWAGELWGDTTTTITRRQEKMGSLAVWDKLQRYLIQGIIQKA